MRQRRDRSFITRDFSRLRGKENGTIPFYRRFFDKINKILKAEFRSQKPGVRMAQFTRIIHPVYSGFTRIIHSVYTKNTLGEQPVYTENTPSAHSVHTECTLKIHPVHTPRTPRAHTEYTRCTLGAQEGRVRRRENLK